jgi:hypothetical protein
MDESSENPRAERKATSKSAAKGKSGRKKPYVKPTFLYEKVFEISALACGKTQILPLQCTINIKTS